MNDELEARKNEIMEQETAAALERVQKRLAEEEARPLRDEYSAAMLKARGNKSALRRVKEHYRSLGVPVDQIGFNL